MSSPDDKAPYYLPIQDEVEIFTQAHNSRLPVLLKGPTGCGKTRFVGRGTLLAISMVTQGTV